MTVLIPFLSIFIIINVILIFYMSTNSKFQENIIRLNEVEANIDAALSKRYDWLNKSVEIIKNVTGKEDVMPTFVQLRSKKISNFELDKQLYGAIDEFNKYPRDFENLKDDEEYMKIEINLLESESEIVALRKYYNDIAKKYNKLTNSFPSSLIALFKKYKSKEYFEKRERKDFLDQLRT